jgi:hypothetical protein
MISLNQAISPQILNNYISMSAAASYSGYCLQYLRLQLRNANLEGVKIEQLWLVEKNAFDLYIKHTQDAIDYHLTAVKFGYMLNLVIDK